jgi:D-tyrosyl-tRNA(Tyr) deacylase
MKALIQRVTQASVTVEGDTIGAIDQGLLVFLGVEKDDDPSHVERMAKKLLAYRVFADEQGKMNCSVSDINGGILVVSQFTLAAETKKGLRPGFSQAAEPSKAELLYQSLLETLKNSGLLIQAGQFAADMQVGLINDGPVTFLLDV